MNAINERCPWSGKPVAEDSLTRYRGVEVGFCDHGCRDKFDAATNLFDAAIEARRPVATPIGLRAGPEVYAPRHCRSHEPIATGAARFKFVTIEKDRGSLDTDAARAAVADYARACPHIWTGSDRALGHIIVHAGEDAIWLLAQWWTPGAILRGLIARAPLHFMDFAPADASLQGCVWELAVIAHERAAWIRHMMCAEPDIHGFLADRFPGGMY